MSDLIALPACLSILTVLTIRDSYTLGPRIAHQSLQARPCMKTCVEWLATTQAGTNRTTLEGT